jgi:serine kinase of HPr protein (carbohydrate metabolism regulator)
MTVRELIDKTGWRVEAGGNALEREISSCYVSDLLSWVMAHGKEGTAWVTVQTHLNVIAVACLHDFSCVIIPEDIEIPGETLFKADEEGIPVIKCGLSGYGVCRELSGMQIPEV